LTLGIGTRLKHRTNAFLYFNSLKVHQIPSKSLNIELGNELRVNSNITGDQEKSDICCFSDGSFAVVWQSNGTNGDGYEIYVKLYDSSGNNKTNDILVNTNVTNNQENPSVSCFSDGHFVIVWQHEVTPTDDDIYAKIFDSTGINVTEDIILNNYTLGYQQYPGVCCINDTYFVATWQNAGDIYASVFDLVGNNITDQIQINTYTPATQSRPSVCCFKNGSFVISWQSDDQDGSDYGVYCRIFDFLANNVTDEILVNTYTQSTQWYPSICCFFNGSFVITWFGKGKKDDDGVYAKLFDSTGKNMTGDILVNTITTGVQAFPDICCFIDGSFVVIWDNNGTDGDEYNICLKIFDPSGNNMTSDVQINLYAINDQRFPSICCYSENSFIAVWQSEGQDGSGQGIYLRTGHFASPVHSSIEAVLILIYLYFEALDDIGLFYMIGGSIAAVIVIFLVIWKRRK